MDWGNPKPKKYLLVYLYIDAELCLTPGSGGPEG
jgi:hypothetical protein